MEKKMENDMETGIIGVCRDYMSYHGYQGYLETSTGGHRGESCPQPLVSLSPKP